MELFVTCLLSKTSVVFKVRKLLNVVSLSWARHFLCVAVQSGVMATRNMAKHRQNQKAAPKPERGFQLSANNRLLPIFPFSFQLLEQHLKLSEGFHL